MNMKIEYAGSLAQDILKMCAEIRQETQGFLDIVGLDKIEDLAFLPETKQIELNNLYKRWLKCQKCEHYRTEPAGFCLYWGAVFDKMTDSELRRCLQRTSIDITDAAY